MRGAAVRLLAVFAAAGFVAWLPTRLSDYHQLQGAGVATFFIAILGLNILTGYTGQLSLGHGAFMLIGGYTTAILHAHPYFGHHWGVIETLPVSAAVAFGAGVLVGVPALRLRGVYLALATFSVALVVPALVRKFSHFTNGTKGIQLLRFPTGHYLYVISWTVAGIMFVLAWLVLRGRIGRAFRAVRDSELAAVSSGISLPVYKTLAFGISAAFAGIAGSLLVVGADYAHPDEFTLLLSLGILIGAVVGGLGSLWGVAFGALFVYELTPVGTLATLIHDHVTSAQDAPTVVEGVALILIMVLLPLGFAGLLRRLVAPVASRFGQSHFGDS
jgi:branched-chain amino acid transport system permease protein